MLKFVGQSRVLFTKNQVLKKNFYLHDWPEDRDEGEYKLFTLNTPSSQPIKINVCINDVPVEMDLDTGASLSVISSSTYNFIARQGMVSPIVKSALRLQTYTGEPIPVLGITAVKVSYLNQHVELQLPVVDGEGPDLMGREWIGHFKVNLGEINHLEHAQPLQEVLNKHAAVFDGELGSLKDVERY